MEKLQLKVKSASKLSGLILSFIFIFFSSFGQTEKDLIHNQFLDLYDKEEKTPVFSEVVIDENWLVYLSDSINIEHGLRGKCRIKDLQNVLNKFDFNLIIEESKSHHDFKEWDKQKLSGIKLNKKIPRRGTYFQFSVPYFAEDWGIIRRKYFVKNELLEDMILIFYYEEGEEKWKQMCEMILYLELPNYSF
ncbi:hypothetical protein [Aquiflexum lacus]|uniref:hypothetical protein n=1 Tax=Aquiflexum lacus TaxID=2483805 RepID=UPI0018950E0B|nr:hypothetical protein [Aquiflexum lacus]